MVRERIADDIYVFTSQSYIQVTAGAILTSEGVILIDTLYFPEETKAIKEFLHDRLGLQVKYVINTHYHADHSQGTYLFPNAQIISHRLCRNFLDSMGRDGLEEAKKESEELNEVQIQLPNMIFDSGALQLHLGNKTVELYHMPGHSMDMIGIFEKSQRIFFASDNMMPVPTIFDGQPEALMQSLNMIMSLEPESIVRGHGEIILKGEIQQSVQSDLDYLNRIQQGVAGIVRNGNSPNSLLDLDIEHFGKSRVSLNGFGADLHYANLQKIYRDLNATIHHKVASK